MASKGLPAGQSTAGGAVEVLAAATAAAAAATWFASWFIFCLRPAQYLAWWAWRLLTDLNLMPHPSQAKWERRAAAAAAAAGKGEVELP